ncbi:MAG: hypothetical protein QXO75_04430 [Nitrososphaerota archaeon]
MLVAFDTQQVISGKLKFPVKVIFPFCFSLLPEFILNDFISVFFLITNLKIIKNQLIIKVTDSLENFRYRNALYLAFYQGIENIRTYIEMGGKNKEVISDYIFTLIKLL